MSLEKLQALCVSPFDGKSRQRRELLFNTLECCVQEILLAKLPSEIVVNGSFLTKKPEPDDIDAKLYISHDLFDRFSSQQKILIDNFIDLGYSQYLQIDVSPIYPLGHDRYGGAEDLRQQGEDYGIEHSKQWLKGYAVLLLWETDVGLRIRR